MPASTTGSAQTVQSPRPVTIGCDLSRHAAREHLVEQLRTLGVAVFTGIRGPERLLAFAGTLMSIVTHPDADPAGLTTITDLGPGRAATQRRRLHPTCSACAYRPLRSRPAAGAVADLVRQQRRHRRLMPADRRPER
jgi:hypothetical protein